MPNPSSTSPDPAHRLPDLVGEALDLPADARAGFLERACASDAALLAEALSLLGHDGADGFLETPVGALARDALGPRDDSGELAPGALLGECEIVRFLGQGGMGEVYLARDTRLERSVAVKLLKRSPDDDALLHRFRHERKVLAGLTHPNIARLYGGGTTPERRSYLVMEYVEGERLDRFCETRGLKISERLTLFRKVCAAVAYAHQNLVVHRDLKPANIRVTPEGEPKLLDFGIAKLLDPETATAGLEATVTLQGAMTPGYASPEQIKGEPITTASDVYSLGVVLYELLTGQRPHAAHGQRPDELARAICEQEPARPSTVAGRTAPTESVAAPGGETPARLRRLLEGDLDNIVAKALRKEPARRYPSVLALSEDLRRHCAGLPVSARKDTLAYRTDKFVRRHKVTVLAAALVTLALVGALAVTSWQVHVVRQERDHARIAQRQAERLNGFLQTLLGSANPEKGPGRDLKVIDVLGQAAQKLDSELAGEPALLAQAHLTVGQAYTGLRVADQAFAHLREAVRLDQRLYGDDDLTTARAKTALAVALYTLERRYDEAAPLLQQALPVVRRQPAAEQNDLPIILFYLGQNLERARERGKAQALRAESLALTAKLDGEVSEANAARLAVIGQTKLSLDDFIGAEASYRQAVETYRHLRSRNPAFAGTLTYLAYAMILNGKLDQEPEAVLAEAADHYHDTVGTESVPYYFNLGTLGWLHYLRGNYPTAESELRTALAYVTTRVPKGEMDVVGGTVTLAMTFTREGRPAEAEPLLRESLDLVKAHHLNSTTASLINVQTELGRCLADQGRYTDAEGFYLAAYDDARSDPGVSAAKTKVLAQQIRDFYLVRGKPEEAVRFVGESAVLPPPKP